MSKKADIIEEIYEKLTEKQAMFCLLYTTDKDCFGNAARSYMRAYNLSEKQYKSALAHGYRLVVNGHVRKYIKKMLLDRYKHSFVDSEHSKLISQDKNLIAKLGAISEYNKVTNRLKEREINIGTVTYMWKGDHRKKPDQAKELPKKSLQTPEKRTKKGKFTINASS